MVLFFYFVNCVDGQEGNYPEKQNILNCARFVADVIICNIS